MHYIGSLSDKNFKTYLASCHSAPEPVSKMDPVYYPIRGWPDIPINKKIIKGASGSSIQAPGDEGDTVDEAASTDSEESFEERHVLSGDPSETLGELVGHLHILLVNRILSCISSSLTEFFP